jgi:cation diffusion facilitator family transporter
MFPSPIPLSDEVLVARKKRNQALTRIARYGIIIRLCIGIAELIGYYAFDSAVLLMDALSTFADVAASAILIFSIKIADRPPDSNHPFGHGRFEPLVGLQMAVFLVLGGSWMLWQQLHTLISPVKHEIIHSSAFVLPFLAVILLELGFRKMIHIARKEHSPALEAEAYHFRIDSLNSVMALIALALAALMPTSSYLFDHVGAMAIAIFMVGVGVFAARSNIHQLLDHTPGQEYFSLVQSAARSVPGVLGTEKIRIQQYGPDAHVDIDVEVDPKLPVDAAHAISQQVRSAIQTAWPQVRDVTVHIEPFYENDHL